jgi:phosphoenolpyruvate synthase/pyruvate phosphate dikinase
MRMRFISDSDAHEQVLASIGGKAKNLFQLKRLGYYVPRFVVIPAVLEQAPIDDLFDGNSDNAETFINEIVRHFPQTTHFAVRSSALDEDGERFSYAGQFESYLHVPISDLAEKINHVRNSARSARVTDYRKYHVIRHPAGIAVIIQEMVKVDVSGVAFGMHPVTGDPRQKIINAVFGLGEGIVSGEFDADTYILEQGNVKQKLARKVFSVVIDLEKGGTKKVPVASALQLSSTLTTSQVKELGAILDKLKNELGAPQDIEFAYANNKLFLLQTRPITTATQLGSSQEEYILWDNSNIIESYPGVTTPLTFSFISKSYEVAYKLFSSYLGVSDRVIKENERVFAQTLGFINGRVYYNLKTWYHMLAMLPGYSINARYMEKMMGVKEQFDIPDQYRLSKSKAWISIFKMVIQMVFRFVSLTAKRRAFMALLNQTIDHYKQIDLSNKNANELVALYRNFEKTLLNEWKAPLLNDFFAMIAFGLLQKNCEKLNTGQPNLHNDLLCGSNDIISTEPVHRTIAIATVINQKPDLKAIFINHGEKEIWKQLAIHAEYADIKENIARYIDDFGERCVGELKLETVSYTQEPSEFVRLLKSYVSNGITAEQFSGLREQELRQNAEKRIAETLKDRRLARWKFEKIIAYARELVSARENLRYQRTRAFGIVRIIFSHIGDLFYKEQILEDRRDIFYLTQDEIFAYIEGRAVTQDIAGLVSLRKKEFARYATLQPASERFGTYGPVYHKNDFWPTPNAAQAEHGLIGTGCSPGIVRGKARIVLSPRDCDSLQGDILITTSTDPGWVTLFPSASGIIVERGSLLSHSAIVSREMGKPCIVGVTGLLKILKTGDNIEMNGSTGRIQFLDES